jgi:biotin synthase
LSGAGGNLDMVLGFDEALARAVAGAAPARSWLVPLLAAEGPEAERLRMAADELRARTMGDEVHLRALIELSNYCRRNCMYCGLRLDHAGVRRYRLTPAEILALAHQAEDLGYRTVVLQSGEDLYYETEVMAGILRSIKAETDLAITLSLGERSDVTYAAWREAGADRYLLRIETTDPALFAAMHPDGDLERRMRCLGQLKALGYQLGTGVLVGLPGQTVVSTADDVIWMHELGAEMIGVGPFIPHPDTPLAGANGGTLDQALNLLATLRLVFPHAHLPATTALGALDPQGGEKGLEAGANVLMPNLTPEAQREAYLLYPGKPIVDVTSATCRDRIAERVRAMGRTVATDHGHVRR